jgi:7-cyano-7-deazaguanine synthase
VSEVLLLSGGIDSSALARWRPPARALYVDYGQTPAAGEERAARQVALGLSIPFDVLRADCRALGSGILASKPPLLVAPSPEWWPFRNQLLVTLAAGWAVGQGFDSLVLGIVRSDRERHADGRPGFVKALDDLLTLQEGHVHLQAPAIELSSAELLERSGMPDSVLAWTHSCHRAELACGECPGCQKRASVLRAAGRLQ